MDLNRDDFFKALNQKDYLTCIGMLRNEIIDTLSAKIQEKDPNYKYTDLGTLKSSCFKHLGYDEQHVACMLFDLEVKDQPLEEDLSSLMEVYKNLIDVNI